MCAHTVCAYAAPCSARHLSHTTSRDMRMEARPTLHVCWYKGLLPVGGQVAAVAAGAVAATDADTASAAPRPSPEQPHMLPPIPAITAVVAATAADAAFKSLQWFECGAADSALSAATTAATTAAEAEAAVLVMHLSAMASYRVMQHRRQLGKALCGHWQPCQVCLDASLLAPQAASSLSQTTCIVQVMAQTTRCQLCTKCQACMHQIDKAVLGHCTDEPLPSRLQRSKSDKIDNPSHAVCPCGALHTSRSRCCNGRHSHAVSRAVHATLPSPAMRVQMLCRQSLPAPHVLPVQQHIAHPDHAPRCDENVKDHWVLRFLHDLQLLPT